MSILIDVYLLFILHTLCVLSETTNNRKLLIEIARHGARTGGYFDSIWGSELNYGKLTPMGMRQHYLIGKEIVAKYLQEYEEKELHTHTRSSDVPRCIMSAQSQMLGILESLKEKKLTPTQTRKAVPPLSRDTEIENIIHILDNNPLPLDIKLPIIHTPPKSTDPFNGASCPKAWRAAWKSFLQSEAVGRIVGEYIYEVEEIMGEVFKGGEYDYGDIYGVVASVSQVVFDCRGDQVPLSSHLLLVAGALYRSLFPYTNGVLDVNIYSLIATSAMREVIAIIDQWESGGNGNGDLGDSRDSRNSQNSTPTGQFNLILTHDSILGCILAFMGFQFKGDNIVEFASNLLFEVYSRGDGGNLIVQITYNGKPFVFCGLGCTYPEFKRVLEDKFVPNQELKEGCN